MPATRRKATAAPTGAAQQQQQQQSTLSFNNKPSRITKAHVADVSKKSKLSEASTASKKAIVAEISTSEPEKDGAEVEAPEIVDIPSSPPVAVTKSKSSKSKSKRKSQSNDELLLDEARARANKVSDAQIKKYWKTEEDGRLAPRVHQSHIPLPEKILRHFDLSSQYGPCIGIPRLARWERANRLDLGPPIEVLAVLLKEENKKDDKDRDAGRRAYIEELAGGGAKKVTVD